MMHEFDWNTFLEKNKCKAVPEESFTHVENSLFNGIKKGMLLEVCHSNNPDVYWIAEITMVCGHLLRIKFIGADDDFWCDITTSKVHPLGWCGKYEESIEPPEEIIQKIGDKIIDLMKSAVLNSSNVSEEALNNKGLSPIDRIKSGMKIEVQSLLDPFRYWIGTVKENLGGRLKLAYDGSEDDLDPIWVFYSSPRLSSFGYVTSKGSPWQFKYPGKVNKFTCKNKLSTLLRHCAEESIKDPTPSDLFQPQPKSEVHNFVVGMKLEALDPVTMKSVMPATVIKVFNIYYFLVVIDDHLNDYEDTKMAWVCNMTHPYIFPIGWAQSNTVDFTAPKIWESGPFDWDEYLSMTSSVPAPEYCFGEKEQKQGFEPDLKLEVAYPEEKDEIHAASIERVIHHLLHIKLLSSGEKIYCSHTSQMLYPVGWCDSNEHQLLIPDPAYKDDPVITAPAKEEVKILTEEWCDRIYFNYKCYAGSFINKNKLAELPKHVGPGPLSLVLKEVLNMIISTSYKPGKMLKDWESEMLGEPGMRKELLKAKLKTNTYRAYIPVVSEASEVAAFCQSVCGHLQACPHLFGPAEYPEQCPENCQQVDKTKFHNIDKRGKRGFFGRKKRRRGAHLRGDNKEKQSSQETRSNKDGNESGNESENSHSTTTPPSEAGTRADSPDSIDNKRSKRKREARPELPKSEIKTRGAKLPNFAQQMKTAHWDKKDLDAIYNKTCAKPQKMDSESDYESRTSSSEKNDDRSDVSDCEEPELKRPHDDKYSDTKSFRGNNFSSKTNSPMPWTRKNSKLTSNPLYWSVNDVHSYLSSTEDCKCLADKLREEEIDGAAFIMLNLPMLEDFLHMKTEYALQLCKHITMIKWYYVVNFEEANSDS